jgi:L-ascorbate metabolism protein UlaG (beta-lactamase superfamily)/quinol monooxygenase YgiN
MNEEKNRVVAFVVQFQSRAGAGDEVAGILARHVAASRSEPGCISFSAFRDPGDPDRFALYEQYADEQALLEHKQSAHFARYFQGQVIPLMRGREWSKYEEIAAGAPSFGGASSGTGTGTAATAMGIRMIGGPTAVLEIGGLRLVTDPTFDEPRDYPLGAGHALSKTAGPAIRPAEIGRADAVLLSHDQHPDNLDLAGRDYLSQVPLVLTTASAAKRLGGNCRELGLWQHVDLPRPGGGALRVTRTPARHGPDGTEHLTGEVAGFVLSGTDVPTVYVSGDNASLDVVRAVAGRLGPVDVALLFVGAAKIPLLGDAYLTLTSAQAAEAARILGAGQVIPLHYQGWSHFTEGADELRAAFAAARLDSRLILLRLPPPGHASTIEA